VRTPPTAREVKLLGARKDRKGNDHVGSAACSEMVDLLPCRVRDRLKSLTRSTSGGVMRIKYIIPFPFDDEGIANRAAQIPTELLGPDTEVECVAVRNSATLVDCYYEDLVFDMYITEAGLRAEEEGYDAVIMDTVSDSGLWALRSRLTIPVIGPGLVSYLIGALLGKRFSIVTMWDKWNHLYEKNLALYDLKQKCASIRAVNIPPDVEALFTGKEEEMFEKLTAEAQKAIDEDGADVILLGSTTMHQAGDYMSAHLPAPVVNPGPVAIKLTESIVQLGLSHSKVAYPSPSSIIDDRFFSLAGAGAEAGV
jgi:allantoin racemase